MAMTDQAASSKTHPKLPMKEVNILLLGETGVGKSTWINAIANYLNYDTLENAIEAWKASPTVLIPSQFTMTDDNFKEITVPIGGTDKNEDHTAGQSGTQEPKTYRFQAGNILVRVIDTPGIGDTRGIEQDKANFQKIMNHISHVDVIHGICFLLKPNDSRANVYFEFCIKELVTQLHKDCIQNIAFCFTNSRSTFYRPGDTITTLRALLTDKITGKLLIPLEQNTMYCLDNEAFRFLAAVNHGQSFEDGEKSNFAQSWEKSVDVTGRMVDYFLTLKPHNTQSTVTLNTTRQTLIRLVIPLADVSQMIQINIGMLESQVKDLNKLGAEAKDLEKHLTIQQMSADKIDLPYPRTVCTDAKCCTRISIYKCDGVEQQYVNEFNQVCHDNCQVPHVATDTCPSAELKNCWAMQESGLICRLKECGHGWEKHMHIKYDLKKKLINVIDQNVRINLKTKEERIAAMRFAIKTREKLREDNQAEQKIITTTSVKFAVFLKENSITPYNNAVIKYVDFLIRKEEDNELYGGGKETLLKLKEMKRTYEAEERVLLDAIKKTNGAKILLPLEGINESLKDLYRLPINGKKIQEFLGAATWSDSRRYQEKAVTPIQKSSGGSKKKKGFLILQRKQSTVQSRSNQQGFVVSVFHAPFILSWSRVAGA